MECINLKERFGKRYKVRYAEDYFAQYGPRAITVDPWYQIIPCIGGEIYPHGGDKLAAFLRRGPRAEALKRLGCVAVKTIGSDGVTVLFAVADFDQVAEIMRPRKRAQRNLTPEQRREIGNRLKAAREGRLSMQGCRPIVQESTIGA